MPQSVKNPPAMQMTPIWFLGQEDPLEKDRLPTPVFLGFPRGSAGNESACNVGDIWSLDWEDPLEKGKATHSSILTYRIPNLPIPVHCSSLIPKMSMFILAISCLTISNLPWFMDLTFQVSIYCCLQHWTLLLSPVTFTTGCCFCFGSVSSFFLELFLHWSPVAYWAPTDLGN